MFTPLLFICFTTLLCITAPTLGNPAINNESRIVIDQRQTGKYNIHVSIKDVAIIELDRNDFKDVLSNGDLDEYYYDDDDFTIKPIPGWFPVPSKPTMSTEQPNLMQPSTTQPPLNLTSIIHNLNSFGITNLSNKSSSTTPGPLTDQPLRNSSSPKKTSSVVILQQASITPPTKPNNSPYIPMYENGGQIPVQIIMEPVLHPKLRLAQKLPYKGHSHIDPSVRIVGEKPTGFGGVRSRHTIQPTYGRRKVRSSILRKLFGLLIPFQSDSTDE